MGKNILIFADGTGNEGGLLPDESRTNIYKLFCATRTGPDSDIDPSKQIAFYIPGIGTPIPEHTSKWRRRYESVQQAIGLGLKQKIIDCYVAIISVWRPGDRIYLFGFSRGGYTVRCVSHVLELCGIPTKEPGAQSISLDPKRLRKVAGSAVSTLYRFGLTVVDLSKRQSLVKAFQEQHGSQTGSGVGATPYFIGVWDTVAAIGLARFLLDRYDQHSPKEVRFVRHAMAIDERRKDFARVKWGGTSLPKRIEGEPQPFEQIWFAGNHADIGGSYPENESRLSDITLKWMADFISKELHPDAQVCLNEQFLKLFPSCDGMLHDECNVGVAGTLFHWNSADRKVPQDAQLHETVYQRLEMESVRNYDGYGPYRPKPLAEHDKARKYFTPAPHQS